MKKLLIAPVIPVLVLIWASLLPIEPVSLFIWGLIGLIPFIVLSTFTLFASRKKGFLRLAVTTVFSCIVIAVSVVATQWPLRLAFLLSADRFDSVASQVKDDRPIAIPFWIGPFKITGAEVSRDGIVCLWTDPTSGDHDGFVQTSPDFLPFNLWSSVRLSEKWQYITED